MFTLIAILKKTNNKKKPTAHPTCIPLALEAEQESYFLRFELSQSPQGSVFLPFDVLLKECKVCTCCRRLESS